MKKIIIALLLQTSLAFCQQEASVWYFGENAGLKFENDGSVTPLSDGQLNTEEGCSSIADSSGNLLFYTDGRTVWDRNHVRMPNGDFLAGTELFGDISSTQSGIIIPKPGSPNIYYIFTVDEPHNENAAVYPNHFSGTYSAPSEGSVPSTDDGFNNGFNYSIVDLGITGTNGSIGDVISRNNHLVTYNPNPTGEEIKYKCSEKITAIKNETTNEYWVVTHFINKFYAFKITATGVVTTPVVSTIGPNITLAGYRRNAIGYLKASPNGERLAIVHRQNGTILGDSSFTTGSVLLYDFDEVTGVVSNEQIVLNTNVSPYGVEFSPDSNKLYTTLRVNTTANMELAQFDLLASNITASKVVLYDESAYLFALQLAINNKIYVATAYDSTLGVINNPNATGLACNYVDIGQPLATGKKVKLGLPPFITSFFNVGIMTTNVCLGSSASFNLNTPLTLTSVLWNFGDGTTSTAINPNHVYATAGTYTVTVTATGSAGTATSTRDITIYSLPTLLSSTVSLKQCDDNNDGFSSFNLNESTSLLVSSPTGLTFSYFETALDAQNNSNAITNFTAYTNQIVSNDSVFVRVQNANGCFRVAQLDLIVSTTLIPASFQRVFTKCDDAASGSITDGVSNDFDFNSVTAEIQALYPPGQLLNITYYKNITDALAEANAITNISNYSNLGYPNTQNIYVRVDSQLNNECLGLGHHITLNVERIPIVQPQVIRHCDDDHDGIYGFDTSTLEATLLNGLTGVTVSYTNSSGTPVVMSNPFSTTSQTITATVTNATPTACSFSSTIEFIVDDLPEAFPINANLTTVCDDETDPALQNGIYPFDTSTFQSTILGSQTGMIVKYYDGFGNLLPSPLPNPFNSSSQILVAEVSNTINSSCKATHTIPLIVHEKPRINLTGSELVCSNDPSFIKVINAGLNNTSTIGSHSYTWYLNGTPISGATNYDLTVNTEGIYTVDVENAFGCVSTRTVTVTASNTATIDAIEVNDLVNNNSILILVSGDGTYTYSVDGANYQSSNSFNNLLPGIYTVYVNDELGCGITQQEISILGIPKFFTPNGDGTNDYWNIDGVSQQFNDKATIKIYDRFGKLMKQIKPLSVGWDGTYNGYTVISDDYWYVIELEDGRIVKGHFALVR